ncbi:MAG: hypothetical protein ACE5I5_10245 [Candidatus Heimdallarchaeota archaeon]
MDVSVDSTLGGVFGFRGYPIKDTITMEEALKCLHDNKNRPKSIKRQFIPGIDLVSQVERSSGFLFVRYLEGFKPTYRSLVDETSEHFVTKQIKVSVPIHNHLIDATLFSKGAVNDRWFFVQGKDVGDAYGRLNRYFRTLGLLKKVSVSNVLGLPHQEAVVQDILVALYFQNLYGARIIGIKIAGKRYSVMGTRVRYSGGFDLRRSEFADEINDKVRTEEKIESLTLVLSRDSVPASVGSRIPVFTIRNDLRISSRSKINNKTVNTAITLSKLLEEYKRNFVRVNLEEERKVLLRPLVSLENFL